MGNAGTAVFEAVGRFGPLRKEAQAASRDLEGMSQSAEDFGKRGSQAFDQVGARSERIGKKLDGVGKSLSLKVGTPLTLIGGAAVRSFATFDASITAAGQKTEATAKQIEQMRKLALKMGADTVFSAKDAAGALNTLGALGFSASESMKALPGVLQAAAASGEELGLTTETVAKAMNAFNIDAKDAGHVADVFAQAANSTAIDMQGLGEAMAHAGQLGARFGLSLEGTTASVSRLVDLGVPAASAGVAFRQLIVALASPKPKALKWINDLGIQTRDANGELLDSPALLSNVSQGLDKSNPKFVAAAKAANMTQTEYRQAAIKGIVPFTEAQGALSLELSKGKPFILDSVKQAGKLTQLHKGLAKIMGKDEADAFIKARTENGKFTATGADAVTAITAMGKASDGTSKKVSNIMNKTTKSKLSNLGGSLETLAITLSDKVSPAVDKVIDKLTKFVNKVTEFSDKHDWFGPVIVGAALFLIALGPILIMLGKIVKAFALVKKGAAVLRGVGKTKPPTATTTAVGGVGGVQQVAWSRPMPVYITKGLPAGGAVPGPRGATPAGGRRAEGRAQVTGGGRPAGGAHAARGGRLRGAGRALGGGAAAGATAGALTLATGGGAKDVAKSVALFAGLELAMSGVSKAAAKMGPVLTKIGPAFRLLAVGIGLAVKAFGRLALAMLTNPFVLIIAAVVLLAVLIYKNWDAIKAFLIATWAVIAAAGVAVWNWIKNAAMSVWNWLKANWPLLLAILTGPFGLAVRFIAQHWEQIKAGAAAVKDWVVTKFGEMIEFFKGLPKKIAAAAKGLWDGLTAGFKAVYDWIMGKIQGIIDLIAKVTPGGGKKPKPGGGGNDPGPVPGLSTGGLIGGHGRGDKQLRALEAGEFVVKRSVVSRPGVLAALAGLNAGRAGAGPSMLDAGSLMRANELSKVSGGFKVGGVAAARLAPSVDGKGKTLVYAPTINNPVPERASRSTKRALKDGIFEKAWSV